MKLTKQLIRDVRAGRNSAKTSRVRILKIAREGDESFELDAAAEAELLESIDEADRGETVPAEEVLHALQDRE